MKIRSKRFKKFLALFFLSVLIYQIGFPVAAYALTSGPTAPESTSFEPVDTTDMVNIQTGDFVYNLPLLDVPGPEGGYPLSLSYHSDIQLNEDASWVGLGWTLNPGAITRNENGYPDDDNNVTQYQRTYWSGTSSSTIGVDIGVGLRNASVSFGLTFTNNNNKGFSTEFQGIQLNLNQNVAFEKTGLSLGSSVGINLKTLKTSSSADFSLNGIMKNEGLEMKGSSMGVSLSSNKLDGFQSNGGGSGISFFSNSYDKISTEISGYNYNFTLGIFKLGLSFSNYRAWSDYTTTMYSYGSLYTREGLANGALTDKIFDTYNMYDLNPDGLSMFEAPDASYHTGGSLPDYDNYMVNGQGINGAMRPYLLKGLAVQGNRKSEITGAVTLVPAGSTPPLTWLTSSIPDSYLGNTPPKAGFRFIHDFSNSYRQNKPNFSSGSLSSPFDQSAVYGDNTVTSYDPVSNSLEGSKHIEYFTNSEITNGVAKSKGFVNVTAAGANGFSRTSDGKIGGFSITNEKGVTYHYALPAYATDGVLYSRKIKKSPTDDVKWTKQLRDRPYAYAWYLTSVTGPDFVDRDGNGVANEGDYGYWVNFGYGKWTDSYNWRNPAEGFNRDVDDEFESYSHGSKELYYLNNIQTRTHTAVFEKDIRTDARGVDKSFTAIPPRDGTAYEGAFSQTSKRTLKLNRILLLNNADAAMINPAAGNGVNSVEAGTVNRGQSVIDKYDLAGTGIEEKAVKIIALNYDNSLCPQTPNSFEDNAPNLKSGKLTLLSVNTLGKGGASVLPPLMFDYGPLASEYSSIGGTPSMTPGNNAGSIRMQGVLGMTVSLKPGELVAFKGSDNVKYDAIVTGNRSYMDQNNKLVYEVTFKMIDVLPAGYNVNQSISLESSKNPNYNKEAYDNWGMYKCDFDMNAISSNPNIGRMTTPVSGMNADAWCLRKITTQLGANIEMLYESDTYRNLAIDNRSSLTASNIVVNGTSQQISFNVNNVSGIPLSTLLPLNTKIDMAILFRSMPADDVPLIVSTIEEKVYASLHLINMNNYIPYPPTRYSDQLNGGFIIQSVNDANNSVVISCTDSFVLGTATKSFGTAQNQRPAYTALGGNVYLYNNGSLFNTVYGGGNRVKELRINSLDRISAVKYNYNFLTRPTSSGVTTYEPTSIQKLVFDENLLINHNNTALNNAIKSIYNADFKLHLNRSAAKIFSLSRLLPPPGVMYEYVKTTESVSNSPDNMALNAPWDSYTSSGSTLYRFVVPFSEMVEYKQLGTETSFPSSSAYATKTSNFDLKVNTAAIGNLLSVKKLDRNGVEISGKNYTYLQNGSFSEAGKDQIHADYGYQGLIIERFAKSVWSLPANSGNSTKYGIMTATTDVPNILLEENEYDYKSGIKRNTKYLGYDYYSGAVTKKLNSDSYGNTFLSEMIPAYRKYQQMGLKLADISNKHMLTQEAASYVYRTDASNNKTGMVSAKVQTWSNGVDVLLPGNTDTRIKQNTTGSNTGNVWRKQSEYVWAPEGTAVNNITPLSQFVDFNWGNPAANNNAWLQTSEKTLYNVYSDVLEEKDVNGFYATSIMGYNDSKVIVSATMSKQKELAFCGAEDEMANGRFSGMVSIGEGVVEMGTTLTAPNAHTGYNSLKVDPGKTGFNYTISVEPSKQYMASVWVKGTGFGMPAAALYYQLNGGAPVFSTATVEKRVGAWYQLNLLVNQTTLTGVGNLTIGCKNTDGSTVYFDDFKVQPTLSDTRAFVYDKLTGELAYILDNNNLFTRFEYDAAGRLKATYRETFKNGVVLTATNDYNFGRGH